MAINYVKYCDFCGVSFESTDEFCAEAALRTHERDQHLNKE